MYSHIYLAILLVVLSCRLSSTNAQFRIIRGIDIEIKDSPHTVAIFFRSKYRCLGSLVTLKSVVTVAHSVFNKKWSKLEVLAGETDIRKFGNGKVQQLKVQSINYGDGYTNGSLYMDIAVIKLYGSFASGVTVEPVEICDFILKPGMPMQISGWGGVSLNSEEPSNILKTIEMHTMRKDECQCFYGGKHMDPPTSLSETIICGRPSGSNTYDGDSGAGAIVRKKLCAVVKAGCDDFIMPTLFTDLTNNRVIDFLRRNID